MLAYLVSQTASSPPPDTLSLATPASSNLRAPLSRNTASTKLSPDQQHRKLTELSKSNKQLRRSLVAAKKSLAVQRANSAVHRAALRSSSVQQREHATQKLTASVALQKRMLSTAQAHIAVSEQRITQLEAHEQQQRKQLDQQQQLAKDCKVIMAADEAFDAANLGKVLHQLAVAVSLGHLRPGSFIAQRLSMYGRNLCKSDTQGLRFSEAEMAFYSLLSKTSRRAADLLQGTVSVKGAPDDFSMASAVMNDMVPSRQAIQKYDAKLAEAACIKPIRLCEAEILRIVPEDASECQLTCLAVDATDIAESVTSTLEGEQFSCVGHHDVSAYTGTADPHDNTALIDQFRSLHEPVLQALKNPASLSLQVLLHGLQSVRVFLEQHVSAALQQQAASLRAQVADKTVKWAQKQTHAAASAPSADAAPDLPDDDESARLVCTSYSRQQTRELDRLVREALTVEAKMAAGQAVVRQLAAWLEQHAEESMSGDQVHPNLLVILAQAVISLGNVIAAMKLAANKLLVFKLQTLDHTQCATMRLFVKHEGKEVLRPVLDWLAKRVWELSAGKLHVAFRAFDGGHTRLKDGLQWPTNVVQLKAKLKQQLQHFRGHLDSKSKAKHSTDAYKGMTQPQVKKALINAAYQKHVIALPPAQRHIVAGASCIPHPQISQQHSLQQIQRLVAGILGNVPAAQFAHNNLLQDTHGLASANSQAQTARFIMRRHASSDVHATAPEQPTAVLAPGLEQTVSPDTAAAAQSQPLVSHAATSQQFALVSETAQQLPHAQPTATAHQPPPAILIALADLQHQVQQYPQELAALGTFDPSTKKKYGKCHLSNCKQCSKPTLKKPCPYFRAVASIGTAQQTENLRGVKIPEQNTVL